MDLLFPLPIKFDLNEWVALSSSLMLLIFSIKLKKRFSPTVVLMIFIFNEFLVTCVDNLLALKPYDYYDWMDQAKFELFDIFLYYIIYPLFGYVFLNLFKKFQPKGIHQLLYVVYWAIFSTIYEWIVVKTHVLNYKGWNLFVSSQIYIAIFLINIAFYKWIIPILNLKKNKTELFEKGK